MATRRSRAHPRAGRSVPGGGRVVNTSSISSMLLGPVSLRGKERVFSPLTYLRLFPSSVWRPPSTQPLKSYFYQFEVIFAISRFLSWFKIFPLPWPPGGGGISAVGPQLSVTLRAGIRWDAYSPIWSLAMGSLPSDPQEPLLVPQLPLVRPVRLSNQQYSLSITWCQGLY